MCRAEWPPGQDQTTLSSSERQVGRLDALALAFLVEKSIIEEEYAHKLLHLHDTALNVPSAEIIVCKGCTDQNQSQPEGRAQHRTSAGRASKCGRLLLLEHKTYPDSLRVYPAGVGVAAGQLYRSGPEADAPPTSGAASPDGGFTPSPRWMGERPGFVFRTGELGLGYYADKPSASSSVGQPEAPKVPPPEADLDELD